MTRQPLPPPPATITDNFPEAEAEIITTYHPPVDYYGVPREEATPNLIAKYRARARKAVEGCKGCGLWEMGHGPLPMTIGDRAKGRLAEYAVIGEAPNQTDDRRRGVAVGSGGRVLKGVMESKGMDVEAGVWMNVASCAPRDTEMKAVRRSKEEEQLACRGNLMRQLEASGAKAVLLVGSAALGAFRPDLQVTKVGGMFFVWHVGWGDLVVTAVAHPDGLGKGGRGGGVWDQFGLTVGLFGDCVEEINDPETPFDPFDWFEVRCVRCGRGVECWDRDGVAYCEEHWERYKWSWRRAGEKWDGVVDLEKVRLRGGRKRAVVKGKNVDKGQRSLEEMMVGEEGGEG